MTMNEVEERILTILAQRHDSEICHCRTDELHIDFIRSVANSKTKLAEQAKKILTLEDANLERWYA